MKGTRQQQLTPLTEITRHNISNSESIDLWNNLQLGSLCVFFAYTD